MGKCSESRVEEICDVLIKQAFINSDFVTRKNLAARNEELENEVAALKRKVYSLEVRQETNVYFRDVLFRRIDDNEQYSRKTHLILDGFKIPDRMSDSDIKQLVLDEIQRLKLDISKVEVDRAHRHGAPYTDSRGVQHTRIVCRFTTWSARDKFYNARRDSSVFATADLTERRLGIFSRARAVLADTTSHAHAEMKAVYVDRNCRLSAISKNGKHYKFSSNEEFDRLADFMEDSSPTVSANFRTLRYSHAKTMAAVTAADTAADSGPATARRRSEEQGRAIALVATATGGTAIPSAAPAPDATATPSGSSDSQETAYNLRSR